MEVRHQCVHNPEGIRRVDEEFCFARPSSKPSGGCFLNLLERRLQEAYTGSTYRHHSASARFALDYRRSGCGQQFTPFSVHAMLTEVIDMNWLESAKANVQGDGGPLDAALLQSLKQRWCEM